jgi:hypothetical protein
MKLIAIIRHGKNCSVSSKALEFSRLISDRWHFINFRIHGTSFDLISDGNNSTEASQPTKY